MDPVTIERHVDLDLTSDDLWERFVDGDGLGDWLGDEADVDLAPGSVGTVVDDGLVRRLHVERVEADPVTGRRELAFTWWLDGDPDTASRVVIDVESMPAGGSRLHISETFGRPDAAEMSATVADAATAWEVRVASLWACTVAAALLAG